MTDDQELATTATCDQCGGAGYLCELPDSTCRLKRLAREHCETVRIVGDEVYHDATIRRLARVLRSVEDAAWARLSVARTKELERLTSRVSELEASMLPTSGDCAARLERLIASGDYQDWRAVVDCGRDLIAEVRRLRVVLPTCERGPKACDLEIHLLRWQRDVARAELAKLLNAHRNASDECSGAWETCGCDTCAERRKVGGNVR